MKLRKSLLACLVLACTVPLSGQAQIVREDGVKSIAGILVPGSREAVEWRFKSRGGEILFATLDAEIYRIQGGGEHEPTPLAAGGCSEDTGPGLFYIEVVQQADGAVLCHAEKPLPPPGWMRDPRLACMLPESTGPAGYLLRVGLKPVQETPQAYYSFLLNVSHRGIAVSGTTIESAVAASRVGGF